MVVDICLGYAQFFLHTKLNGQSMGIPTCLAVHLVALHRLIAVEGVLDRACQNVVNTGMTIGRRRTFEEYKLL